LHLGEKNDLFNHLSSWHETWCVYGFSCSSVSSLICVHFVYAYFCKCMWEAGLSWVIFLGQGCWVTTKVWWSTCGLMACSTA